MRVADLPAMDYEGMTAPDALVKFFTDLGWNPKEQSLDPTRIKLSKADHLALTSRLDLLHPDNITEVHAMLCNKGPSCNPAVKEGKVYLYSGWVIDDNGGE